MTLPVVSSTSAFSGERAKSSSTPSSTAISSLRYCDSRSAYVGESGHPIHAATPFMPEYPPAASRVANRSSILSSQEIAVCPAEASCRDQNVFPAPDMPISARRSGLCKLGFICERNDRPELLQPHLVVAIPGGHVGNNHAIARPKTPNNLGAVFGDVAHLHRHAPCLRSVIRNLKNRQRRMRLQFLWQIGRVRQAFCFDCAVHRHAGVRARRLPAVCFDVHADRAILYGRVNMYH